MKQRLISAGVGLILLEVVLYFFDTLVLNTAVALIVILGLYEVLHAAGCMKDKFLVVAACLYGGLIPFIPHHSAARIFPLVTFVYIAVLFLIMLARHNEISALQIGFTFFISTIIPFSLTVSIYMRDRMGEAAALYYILIALAGAWMSDTGAYFVGRAFGRHKLAPQISPKKTVEGAISGVVICTISLLLISAAFQWAAPGYFAQEVWINYPLLAVLAPVISVSGMLGDLSASVIKRQNHIKDFGNIMPGHGGVVDRFDSVFFTAPTVFMLTQYLTFFSVL